MTRLLDALHCKNQGRPPFWLMRQAGRYLPEYQELRKKHSLLEMFHNPDLIVEVTRMPFARLPLDAAILFADILSVLDGLGLKWDFDEGPKVETDLSKMALRDPQKVYNHTREAIGRLKEELAVPLLGFAGAPFTIASYLLEGGSSREFAKTKALLYSEPGKMHQLLATITEATIAYLRVQIASGVDAVQLFDSWAGALDLFAFRTFSLPYMQKILQAIEVPTIVFCRGSSLFAQDLASINPTAISFDWSLPIDVLRKNVPAHIAVQGNLDPSILFGSKEEIKKEAGRIVNSMKGEPGFIFNLGHGILPKTPFENVALLAEYVTAQ